VFAGWLQNEKLTHECGDLNQLLSRISGTQELFDYEVAAQRRDAAQSSDSG